MLAAWIIAAMRSAGWEQVESSPGDGYVRFRRPGTTRIVTIPTDPSDPEFSTFMSAAFMEFMAGLRVVPKKDGPEPPEETPEATPMRWPSIGDWVLVWGQVAAGSAHPDDMIVEFHSHSDQWQGVVRRDRTTRPTREPDFVSQCPALFRHLTDYSTLVRCNKPAGHSGMHKTTTGQWGDTEVVGFFEDK